MSGQPSTIQNLAAAVPQALAMLAAMELDVFTPLADSALTIEQLATALGVRADKLRPVLVVLVSAGLLCVDGECFANSAEADQFLVRGRATYMGSVHELWSDMWQAELLTARSVRMAVPQAKHDYNAMSADELRSLVRGLHSGSVSAARVLMAARDLSQHRHLLDVGGGSGGLALTIAETFSEVRATIVDLAVVAPLTREFVAQSHASERVTVQALDMVRCAPDGKFDLAVCNRFIQVLSPDEASRAIANIARALAPNGTLHILGHVLDDSGLSPQGAVAFGLFALNVFDGGTAHNESQYRAWLREAGLPNITRELLPNGYSLMSASKRS
ncbi:MAG: methyltransferase [Chloroflexi bacterium]|nr:methyltransferase [Chloroflexota bacterium]